VLSDIREDLDVMFKKISQFNGLLMSAVICGEQAKLQVQEQLLKKMKEGYTNI
jgi:hypothetical protein